MSAGAKCSGVGIALQYFKTTTVREALFSFDTAAALYSIELP